ncbi:MAG: beta-hydroxyacyl-ACP dehydratase [Prevotella sp.]|nr:beta-hydroxyacyl-ACP dehydratase [Prevotella sp.]
MIRGEGIKRLIPQRYPMLMVDGFESQADNQARTVLQVRNDNMFVYENGELAESGLIEHMAQSVSALAGYQSEGDTAPVGIIGEVKHFECYRRPKTGERVDTVVAFTFSFGNVSLADATSYVDGEKIAEVKLKVFLQSK